MKLPSWMSPLLDWSPWHLRATCRDLIDVNQLGLKLFDAERRKSANCNASMVEAWNEANKWHRSFEAEQKIVVIRDKLLLELDVEIVKLKADAYNLQSPVHSICNENLTEALAMGIGAVIEMDGEPAKDPKHVPFCDDCRGPIKRGMPYHVLTIRHGDCRFLPSSDSEKISPSDLKQENPNNLSLASPELSQTSPGVISDFSLALSAADSETVGSLPGVVIKVGNCAAKVQYDNPEQLSEFMQPSESHD